MTFPSVGFEIPFVTLWAGSSPGQACLYSRDAGLSVVRSLGRDFGGPVGSRSLTEVKK